MYINIMKYTRNNVRKKLEEMPPGLYTINMTYNCSLEKVATSISYVNQSDSYDTFYGFFKTLMMIKKYKEKG